MATQACDSRKSRPAPIPVWKSSRTVKRVILVASLFFLLLLWCSAWPGALLAAQSPPSQSRSQTTVPLGIALESYPYPYPVHFLEFEMEGQLVRMAYMDIPASAPANGQTVVLLHGKNFGGYYWENAIHVLGDAGYRVVVPDQIGWGKSSKPDLRYSFSRLAANTARLLDTLGVHQIVLLGHSTGGMLAVRFARTYPQRVIALVLEDPIGLEDYRLTIPPQTDETLFRDELKNTDAEKIRAFYAHYFAHPAADIYGPLAEVQIRVAQSGEFPRWAKSSALAYQMIYEQPVLYDYRLLQPPTLLIVGQEDHVVPLSAYASEEVKGTLGHVVELAGQAINEVPHGALIVIPDAGHIPHIEQPGRFHQAVLNFLEQHPGSQHP
jgi:pimeloyl-ACP methyl ester carboxylesterase